jgi:hypothetical protein
MVITAMLLAGTLCGVQAPDTKPESAPEEAALKAATAANEGRFDDFAKMMDPAALKAFHAGFTGVFEEALKLDKGKAVEQIVPLFGVKTFDDFMALGDDVCFAAFLRGVTRSSPALKEALARMKNVILGKVDEANGTTHVLCRMTPPGAGGEGEGDPILTVISTRKVDGGWRLRLSGNIDTLTASLRQAITGVRPATEPQELKIQPLGLVREGADKLHVVYRPSQASTANPQAKVSALTVTRDDPDWDRFNGPMDAALGTLIKKRVEGS